MAILWPFQVSRNKRASKAFADGQSGSNSTARSASRRHSLLSLRGRLPRDLFLALRPESFEVEKDSLVWIELNRLIYPTHEARPWSKTTSASVIEAHKRRHPGLVESQEVV